VKLSVKTVTAISRKAATEQDPSLEVMGVVLSEGEKDRAEIVVRIRGCHPEPCRVVINVNRNLTPDELAAEITRHLRGAIEAHRSSKGN
jgi:hypothetical protein